MKLSGKPTLSPALLALGLFIFIPGRFAAQAAPQQPPVIIPPVEVVATRFEVLAFNVPAAPAYSPPSRFIAKGGVGQVSLAWETPPDPKVLAFAETYEAQRADLKTMSVSG